MLWGFDTCGIRMHREPVDDFTTLRLTFLSTLYIIYRLGYINGHPEIDNVVNTPRDLAACPRTLLLFSIHSQCIDRRIITYLYVQRQIHDQHRYQSALLTCSSEATSQLVPAKSNLGAFENVDFLPSLKLGFCRGFFLRGSS